MTIWGENRIVGQNYWNLPKQMKSCEKVLGTVWCILNHCQLDMSSAHWHETKRSSSVDWEVKLTCPLPAETDTCTPEIWPVSVPVFTEKHIHTGLFLFICLSIRVVQLWEARLNYTVSDYVWWRSVLIWSWSSWLFNHICAVEVGLSFCGNMRYREGAGGAEVKAQSQSWMWIV